MIDEFGRHRHRPEYKGEMHLWPALYTGDPWIKNKPADTVILALRQGLTEREIEVYFGIPAEDIRQTRDRAIKFGFLETPGMPFVNN